MVPQPIPVEDILAGLDNVASSVESLIASGSYQSAATNAFAAISEINVPLSYVSKSIMVKVNFQDIFKHGDSLFQFNCRLHHSYLKT